MLKSDLFTRVFKLLQLCGTILQRLSLKLFIKQFYGIIANQLRQYLSIFMNLKAIFFLGSIFFPFIIFASTPICSLVSGINVNTSRQMLSICKNGRVVKTFKVALGFKGIGKKHAGDNKTPIGLYNLAYPRKSSQFKVFIPILYPTAKQLAAGYTGRDVGIHGPTQSTNWSWLNHLPYSTRGCIAVGRNNYIDYVANWVKSNPGTKVLII